MDNRSSLQETKHHGEVRFPFNIYPCTIPGDFRQVAVHWQDSMELIYIKRGSGLVQTGAQVCTAQSGDIFVLTPGTLHAIRQAESCTMEYENIIFDVELLGGAEDLCAEKYLLPLQSGRLALPEHITPDEVWYPQAADCLKEAEEANRCKQFGYELCIKGALLRFLALLIAGGTAMDLGPLQRACLCGGCRRAVPVQPQSLYAVVPPDDRTNLYHLFAGISSQRCRRGTSHNRGHHFEHFRAVRV